MMIKRLILTIEVIETTTFTIIRRAAPPVDDQSPIVPGYFGPALALRYGARAAALMIIPRGPARLNGEQLCRADADACNETGSLQEMDELQPHHD